MELLHLRPGGTVLELGCSTGLNFPLLEKFVGDDGKIIGVDLTPGMLAKAEERIRLHGWKNIELIEADASRLESPTKVDGVLSTFALSVMPSPEEVLKKSVMALRTDGRLVLLDLKLTTGSLRFLNPLGVLITRPFGGSYEVGQRQPWEEMGKHLVNVLVRELYLGFVYIASGSKHG